MKVLVIVDMQNDFIDGSLANTKGKEVLDSVIKEIHKDYDAFLLTRDTHEANYLNTLEGKNLPIEHCIANTDGWKINDSLMKEIEKINKPYKIFDKNGFGSYDLIDYLKGLNDDIESITIVGLCSDICVITNALLLRAQFPNLPLYYVADAMYATTSDNQDASIKILNACQIYENKGI